MIYFLDKVLGPRFHLPLPPFELHQAVSYRSRRARGGPSPAFLGDAQPVTWICMDGGWVAQSPSRARWFRLTRCRNLACSAIENQLQIRIAIFRLCGFRRRHLLGRQGARRFPRTVTGTVSSDEQLSLSGTLIVRDFYYDDITLETVQLGSSDTILDGSDGMTGRWSEDLTFLTWRIGTAHIENDLLAMRRMSSNALTASTNR